MANPVPLESAVTQALLDTPLLARDQATADLARHYARLIDTAGDEQDATSELGPKLLAALAALGMTPSSRTAKNGGTSAPVVSDELAKLRARSQQRRSAG